VAFRKAILAGAAGALVWEAALRLLMLIEMISFDMVHELGTLVFPSSGPAYWWPAGMAAHAAVGAAWALFYAYFFWARFPWPPALQGLAFAALPAILAAVIVEPQLQLMHLHREVARLDWQSILVGITPSNLSELLLGHAMFGLTVGAIYTHPVGYPVDRPPRARCSAARGGKSHGERRRADGSFIFATGIECSYPTIDHGKWRRDEMSAMRHYDLWQRDFELARQIAATHLRYGQPLHLIYSAPGRFDWTAT